MNESHQELTIFLTRAERDKTQKEFFRFLTETNKLDPQNFSIFCMEVFGERKALILGQHSYMRALNRSFLSRVQLQNMVKQQVSNPLVAAHIMHNMICLSDDNKLELFDNAEAFTTVVIQKPYLFVYEAGFSYIRLKTVWDLRYGRFTGNTNYVVKINKDGSVHGRSKQKKKRP